jgi:mannose-6-phosphate isomerase-like protein (cupin superfamily)
MKTEYAKLSAYITKDGSEIRELMHPATHGGNPAGQSLAEARVPPGRKTIVHRHHASEEIYHVTAGAGSMCLDGDWFDIAAGDSIRIDPGRPHQLHNTGTATLVVLCCCTPPYSHDDTELLGDSDDPQDHSC